MDDLHPHWRTEPQETSAADNSACDVPPTTEERPVRISAVRTADHGRLHAPSMPSVPRARRRPAAVVGVVLALFVVVVYGAQTGTITGRLPSAGIDIRITAAGVAPATVTAIPGDTITWTNDDMIPHILESDTLPTADGMLETSAIFPGSSVSVTLSADAPTGSYRYISTTSPVVNGEVIIAIAKETAAPQPAPEPAPAPSPTPLSLPPFPSSNPPPVPSPVSPSVPSPVSPSVPSPAPPPTPTPSPTPPPVAQLGLPATVVTTQGTSAAELPHNPYTVDRAGGLPRVSARTTTPPLVRSESARPKSQPETGPALWLVAGTSLGLLLIFTRRHFSSK